MIADEDETDSIFETLDEDSGQYGDEKEKNDYFAEDDRRDEESLRRRGIRWYRVVIFSLV